MCVTLITVYDFHSFLLPILLTAFCTNAVCTKSGGHLKVESLIKNLNCRKLHSILMLLWNKDTCYCSCCLKYKSSSFIRIYIQDVRMAVLFLVTYRQHVQPKMYTCFTALSTQNFVSLHLSGFYSVSVLFFISICGLSEAIFFLPLF